MASDRLRAGRSVISFHSMGLRPFGAPRSVAWITVRSKAGQRCRRRDTALTAKPIQLLFSLGAHRWRAAGLQPVSRASGYRPSDPLRWVGGIQPSTKGGWQFFFRIVDNICLRLDLISRVA